MDFLIPTLETAKHATASVAVPGLSIALELALSIAKKANEIKELRKDCRALADRAAEFALAVYEQLKDGSGETSTQGHVMTLLHDLQDIENMLNRHLRAGKLKRVLFVFRNGKIAKEVKELATRLEDSYRTFMIQAALDNDNKMSILTNGNTRIMQHIDDSAHVGDAARTGISNLAQRLGNNAAFDGNFRLFARENLDFVESLSDSSERRRALTQHGVEGELVRADTSRHTGRVLSRYRAVVQAAGGLTGTRVVVHTYPNRHDRRFVEAVKVAKQTCHPYLLTVLGYSHPGNPNEASYIVTEDYRPLAEHLRSFRGVRKLRVLLQMTTATCMAVDHLEETGLRRLLTAKAFSNLSRRYAFGLSELVYDHSRGGRIKWARDPLMHGLASDGAQTEVPALPADRMCLVDDLRPVEHASAAAVARCWFSLILNPIGVDVAIVGRIWWRYWQAAVERPRYPLGAWLGRNSRNDSWSVLPSRHAGFEVDTTCDGVPLVVPWLGPPPDLPADTPEQVHEDYLGKKMKQASWLDIPETDRDELGVDIMLGTSSTRWTRYQFSCVPVGTVLLFRQGASMPDGHDTVSRVVRSATEPSIAEYTYIGIARDHIYHTEIVVARSTQEAEQTSPPRLWFFLRAHEESQEIAVHSFWSLEKDPTSIPADIALGITPCFERVEGTMDVPLCVSTQHLGDLTFTMQTKMYTQVMELSEDDVFALRELQGNRHTSRNLYNNNLDDSDSERFASCEDGDEGLILADANHDISPVRSKLEDDAESLVTNSEYYDAEECPSIEDTSPRNAGSVRHSQDPSRARRDRSYVPVRGIGSGHTAVIFSPTA